MCSSAIAEWGLALRGGLQFHESPHENFFSLLYQRMEIKGALSQGYETDLWTTARISEVIEREFHVTYHRDHVGRLLRSGGWSHQAPERRSIAQVADLVSAAGAAVVSVINALIIEVLLGRKPGNGWNAADIEKSNGLAALFISASNDSSMRLWEAWTPRSVAAAQSIIAKTSSPSLTTWEPDALLIGTPEIDDPKDPSAIADKVIAALFWSRGTQLLRSIHDQLYLWTGTSYRPVESKYLRSWLYRFTRKAVIVMVDKSGQIIRIPYAPNKHSIDHIVDALEAMAFKEADQFPFWLDAKDNPNRPSPKTIIPFPDGLLSFERWRQDPTCALIPHTSQWFALHCLPYHYDATATCPQFLAFLDSILPGDAEAILALQMWLGYCLTPDTSQHKALLIIGPPRAGKGVLFRIIMALLGEHNIAAPSLASLAQNFGLQALIGKHAAIIADAHAPNNLLVLILDKLKGIIGEDAMTIDRKNREPVTMKLGCRIMMAANELSAFPDPSGALAARLIMIQLRKTFVGREDRGLEARLLAELPGILNWALRGLQKLQEHGRLLQPESGAASLQQVRHLTSPVLKFIEDMCVYPAPGKRISKEDLREAYDLWAIDEDADKISGTHFGVKLLAACPEVETKTHGKRGEDRVKDYCNITLSEEGRDFVRQRHIGEMHPRKFMEMRDAEKERDAERQIRAEAQKEIEQLKKKLKESDDRYWNEECLRRQTLFAAAEAGFTLPPKLLDLKAKIDSRPSAEADPSTPRQADYLQEAASAEAEAKRPKLSPEEEERSRREPEDIHVIQQRMLDAENAGRVVSDPATSTVPTRRSLAAESIDEAPEAEDSDDQPMVDDDDRDVPVDDGQDQTDTAGGYPVPF